MLTSAEIRQSFLDFFREKAHTIVPSSSLLPDSPNLLFTNAGMNQFVPIFLGERVPDVDKWPGAIPGSPRRAADTQKCIRAGGKHNDLDDVGLDTYHHTFFEMLGNWSFGDYFKKEAIEWAWELVVGRWKFPPQRLYATVYSPDKSQGDPSEFDQDAWDFWAEKFRAAGLDPAVQIVNGNKKDNFWMMGDTGPCGPCSELHVDLTPAGDTRGGLVNKGDARCIEIWNLVFIQFNANPDGTFSPLPARHVDTGMGFERVCSIIQGTKNFADFGTESAPAKISNYETDIFRPIFDELEKLSGKEYGSSLPGDSGLPTVADGATAAPGSARVSRAGEACPEPGRRGVSPSRTYELESASTSAGESSSRRDAATSTRDACAPQTAADPTQVQIDIAFRVIADHIRTLSFAIADGIVPSNEGRNYVLRRILRRAVRYGRNLGFHEPFFFKLVDVLARTMGDVFPEIRGKQAHVKETIKREEEAFNRTLDRGIELFEQKVAELEERRSLYADAIRKGEAIQGPGFAISGDQRIIKGDFAFQLYDTYGFPLDLTELMARERGLNVDTAGFEAEMEKQRARARAAQKKTIIELSEVETKEPTRFVGYDALSTSAKILEIVSLKGKTAVILDTSVCYAEMGGQVGDTGELSSGGLSWKVINTQKIGSTFLHFIELNNPAGPVGRLFAELLREKAQEYDDIPSVGMDVTLTVNLWRRRAIERHHTATHLLHYILHEVVSREATQKGSFVGPDKLTFDFNAQPLTHSQLKSIEECVNALIVENAGVSWVEVPYAEVKSRADVMQFFGEKYGDRVRVVQIGGHAGALDGYSMELCGGTHTRATGEIGLFRIVSEGAVAAGIRRIEALSGLRAFDKARGEAELLRTLAGKINAPLTDLEKKLDAVLAQQRELEKQLDALRKKQAAAAAESLLAKAQTIGTTPAIVENLGEATGDQLQAIADALKGRFKGVIVLAGTSAGQVALAATVSPDLTAKIQAGKIIQTIAPIVGGKGGGRPDAARGAGKEPGRIDEALARTRAMLE
jgi:alanyl-tRNA synthetase